MRVHEIAKKYDKTMRYHDIQIAVRLATSAIISASQPLKPCYRVADRSLRASSFSPVYGAINRGQYDECRNRRRRSKKEAT